MQVWYFREKNRVDTLPCRCQNCEFWHPTPLRARLVQSQTPVTTQPLLTDSRGAKTLHRAHSWKWFCHHLFDFPTFYSLLNNLHNHSVHSPAAQLVRYNPVVLLLAALAGSCRCGLEWWSSSAGSTAPAGEALGELGERGELQIGGTKPCLCPSPSQWAHLAQD